MSEQDTTTPPAQAPTPTPPPAPAVQWQTPTADIGPAPGVEFAPHGARLVAYIIDSILLTIVVGILIALAFVPLAGVDLDPETGMIDMDTVSTGGVLIVAMLVILAMLGTILYFPFFWARGGQTPGMRPFSLRVVRDRDGAPIGWGTALLRLVGLWIAGAVFYIGYIWIFIDKRHRGWQDLIAGTVMIKRS